MSGSRARNLPAISQMRTWDRGALIIRMGFWGSLL